MCYCSCHGDTVLTVCHLRDPDPMPHHSHCVKVQEPDWCRVKAHHSCIHRTFYQKQFKTDSVFNHFQSVFNSFSMKLSMFSNHNSCVSTVATIQRLGLASKHLRRESAGWCPWQAPDVPPLQAADYRSTNGRKTKHVLRSKSVCLHKQLGLVRA